MTKKVRLYVLIDPELKEGLEKEAKRKMTSKNRLVSLAIRDYLNKSLNSGGGVIWDLE